MESQDIRDLARVYSLQGEILAIIVTTYGMAAENQTRVSLGQSLAYSESSFNDASEEIKVLASKLDAMT